MSMSVNYDEGWNMISVPVDVSINLEKYEFKSALISNTVYEYSASGYTLISDNILKPGKGYWVKLNKAITVKYPTMPKFTYLVDGSWGIMTVKGEYGLNAGESLEDAIASTGYTDALNLKIVGVGENAIWHDFRFDYNPENGGQPDKLHIENISLKTLTIDDYAIYSRNTKTTMKNVNISGYSGANETDVGGGAMRIRAADYSLENHNENNPTLLNVKVENCCRGIRIQDSNNVYVKNCHVNNVTDNGIYWAAGDYKSTTGCNNSIVDNCKVTNAGQCAFMNIGGANNKFINCDMSGSRGAGLAIYNTNSLVEVSNCSFTNANTYHTQTPYGGNTDDFGGAAIGFSVETGDLSGHLKVTNCNLISGDGSVYYKSNDTGKVEVLNNVYDLSKFPDGKLAAGSSVIIGV